ncbi:MAG: hypothetical protein AB7T37_12700 [Dehalococcoidia bacterium]
MSARLTVVLDDEDLYRRAKIRAAEQGITLKSIIESALEGFLGEGDLPASGAAPAAAIEWDWDAYDRWQALVEEIDAELGPGPLDLSSVKEQLYGAEARPRLPMLAEERAPYGAGEE